MIRLLAVLLFAGVASAWWRVAVVYVRPVAELADAVGHRAGRVACRLLGRHGRSCRGRRDHMP